MDVKYNIRPSGIYQDYSEIIDKIRENGISEEIIYEIKSKSEAHRAWMKQLYDRYRVLEDGVGIFNRRAPKWQKVNNKLNNDYFGEIIAFKTGYFAGKPISYTYSKQRLDERQKNFGGIIKNAFKRMFSKTDNVITDKDYDVISKQINDFLVKNAIADKDAEDTKMAAICGCSARLLYIDPDGEIGVANVPPYEVVILSETEMSNPEFTVRFFGDTKRTVDFYDATNKIRFQDTGSGYGIVDVRSHMFPGCPLIGIPNNSELMGDAERVLTLMDGYDNTLSDANSEIEDFRLAYMKVTGASIDVEDLEAARQQGAFNLPDREADIDFITKQINDAVIEHHLDRLSHNLYRFSQTPDLNDEAFSGNSSGVALKFKLMGLENKCATFERKFSSAIMYMWKLIAGVWSTKGVHMDPYEMVLGFKRNVPLDLLYEAQATAQLKGLVSEPTRLELLSFVDDADYEMEMMQQEIDESMSEPLIDEDGDGDEPSGATATSDRGTGIISEQSA